MNQQIGLKRTQFANFIRQEQRQRIKKQIRQKFVKSINQQIQSLNYFNNYDENQFRTYRVECNIKQKQSLQNFINYMFSKNITKVLADEKNLYFLNDVTAFLYSKPVMQEWQIHICKKIYNNLDQLIKHQFRQSKRDEKGTTLKTSQMSELIVLKYCFDGLLTLMEAHPCYSELWITLSHLRNQQLKNYSFKYFERMFNNRYDNFTSQQITTIVCTLDNFVQDCPKKMSEILTIIQILFSKYEIRPFDVVKLIDILLDFLTQPQLKQKIQVLLQTTLIQNVSSLIDKTHRQMYKNSFEVASKVAYFIGKIYSVEDEELCQKVYMKNVMVLSYIRSWLPTQPNIRIQSLQYLGSGTLTHNSHRCTMYMIFALTNIAICESQMLKTIISESDIYRTLVYMYKLVPVTCRQQITIFLFNVVNRCDDIGVFRVIIQTKLNELLGQMLKQTNSLILKKSLEVIIIICKLLQSENSNSQWVYTLQDFIFQLQTINVTKHLDSLVVNPETKIADLAQLVSQYVKQ